MFKVTPQIADSTNRPLISAAGLILRPFGAEAESVKSMDCVRKQAPGELTHNVVLLLVQVEVQVTWPAGDLL